MSAPVSITIDPDRLLPTTRGAVVVGSVGEYVPACAALRAALAGSDPVEICVHDRTAAVWLSTLAASYGPQRVTVRRYSARDALAERWQIAIPPSVTDVDIRQANLLDEQVTAREGQSFGDLLLEHFLSGLFAFRTFPKIHLPALLDDVDPERWRAATRRPLVARTLREKLTRWESAATNDAVRDLVRRLTDNPAALRRDLCGYLVLRGYPSSLGEKVLGGAWETFRKARVSADGLRLTPDDTANAAREVEYYLTGLREQLTSGEDVAALVEQMSGQLTGEFYFLAALLRERPEWLSPLLLQRITVRFRPLHRGIGSQLAALRKLVKPPEPAEPQPDWNGEQWLDWAEQSYMPHYAWLDVQGRQDDRAADYAVRFADWYYSQFTALKNGKPELFAFAALHGDRDRITAPSTVSLVLIVDNLNYAHFPELGRLFREQGLSLEASRPTFSLVPTATEVGKAGLIAASGDQVDLPAERYPDLVKSVWEPLMKGRGARYLATIGELQHVESLDHALYFLNYLPVDQALHENVQETGRPHAEVIHDRLHTLAASVVEFARRFELENRLLVYVLSDHGSTRIDRGAVNVLSKEFYKGLALDEHHRYLALSDERLEKLPQVATEQCYVMDRQKFKTRENYLAARGYYRFKETSSDFYVHGGLTPEEVVVPFARFSLIPVVPEPPTVRLLTTQFRYAVESRIPIEIGNPNSFPLESVTVSIPDLDAEEQFIHSLPPKQTLRLEIATRFRKTPVSANFRSLTARVRYEAQGKEFALPDVPFEITLKSAMEVTDVDFDL